MVSVFLSFVGFNFLDGYFLLMGDGDPSSSGATGNSSSEGGSGGKPNKPNLTIKIGPQNDLEKDLSNVGNCTHENLSHFVVNTVEDVNQTFCDFGGDHGSDGKPDLHKAFDSVTDNAFVCDSCHAICCKDCVNDYSNDTSPIDATENSGSNNNAK